MIKRIACVCAFVICLAPSYALAQWTNIRVSGTGDANPEEVSIALNPVNPRQLAAGANIDFCFTSSDSGLSWTTNHITHPLGVWGDPCLMFDDSGYLYYEHLEGRADYLHGLLLQRSKNGGLSWDQTPVISYDTVHQQDKGWLSLDRSNTSQRGTIMTSWTQFDAYGSKAPSDSSHIFFARSIDHGVTWLPRVRVDDTAGDCLDGDNTVEGALTTSSPDGEIFVCWSAHNEIYLDRSTDGGKTFGKDQIIADQPGGWDFGVSGIYRANGFPMIFCDQSNGKYRGRLYVMWSDQRRGVTDVYFIHSDDKGKTWSPRIRVNNDSTLRDHFFPSMALDPVTGHIFVVFYDRRATVGEATDVYLATSIDGGESFRNETISQAAFTPSSGVFFGDYIHIAAYDRQVFPIWMRYDDALSVWTAKIIDTAGLSDTSKLGVAPKSQQLSEKGDILRIVNDASSQPTALFELEIPEHIRLVVFDAVGRKVRTVTEGDYGRGAFRIRLDKLSSGSYIVQFTSQSTQLNARFVIMNN